MARKLTEEEKAERKAIKEIEKLMDEDPEMEAALKAIKKNEKKYGKRVHVLPAKTLHCRGTFVENVLGGAASDKQIYSTYIGSKAPDAKTLAEEITMFGEEDVERQGTTIFNRDKNGKVCILAHQFRGFIKHAAQALKRAELLDITAHEKVITQLVTVSAKSDPLNFDKWIPLIPPKGTAMTLNQRPLKGRTAKGEIVSLASSEELPAGTTFEFYIHLLNPRIENTILSWMEYGRYIGLLQWRSAGYGRFRIDIEKNGKWIPLEEVE